MMKLGFGFMRLPLTNPDDYGQVDLEAVKAMVDVFMEQGGRYFDTAYVYHNHMSEIAVRDCLVSRYPRNSFELADKMPLWLLTAPEDHGRIFNEQLERCGVDYFDVYLAHNIGMEGYKNIEKLGTFDFLREKKKQGQARQIGFSFHDSADFLDVVLKEHPEVDVVQLQINYLDWDNESIQSRKCYEVARKHGKRIIVMEPVKGGMLARIPEAAAALLRERHPDWSAPAWAVRFAAGLDGVELVLSGMSNMEQLLDNLSHMRDFKPLTPEERDVVAKVADVIKKSAPIPCTSCQYCVPDCPKDIPIPKYFTLFNDKKRVEPLAYYVQQAYYDNYAKVHGKASDCVKCGECERHCPQKLEVTKLLQTVAKEFEAAAPA